MVTAKVGLPVQWIVYHKRMQGVIVSCDKHEGTMMLQTHCGLPWQAKKVEDGWCAYSGNNTFFATVYTDPETT